MMLHNDDAFSKALVKAFFLCHLQQAGNYSYSKYPTHATIAGMASTYCSKSRRAIRVASLRVPCTWLSKTSTCAVG